MASKFLIGREKLRAVLNKLPAAIKDNVQAGMTASANDLAQEMRSRAPVKSGALRSSIRVERRKDPTIIGALIKAGGPTTTKPVRNGQSPTYDYAMGIELGTQEQLAQPFFYPTYRRSKTKIKRRASADVRKAVAQAAGGTP